MKFTVLAAIPQVALARTEYEEATATFRATAPGQPAFAGRLDHPAGRDAFAVWLKSLLGDEAQADLKVILKVGAEEEVPTPMGPMRGLRIDRESQWKQRGSDNAGVSRWTYWYNSAAKRFVAAEESNTTAAGKVLSRARHELASYDVK